MKQLLIALTAITLFSCKKPEPTPPADCMYNAGDIVYLKLDSTKCIVKYVIDYYETCEYYVRYKDTLGQYVEVRVDEFEITQ